MQNPRALECNGYKKHDIMILVCNTVFSFKIPDCVCIQNTNDEVLYDRTLTSFVLINIGDNMVVTRES